MVDLRFSSALQIMLSVANAAQLGVDIVSSAQLAVGLNSNPSFVRKLLVPLAQAGLLSSIKGKFGGVTLGKAPAQITLADIYVAINPARKLFASREDIPHRCFVTANMERIFDDVSTRSQAAVLGVLGELTLAGYLREYAVNAEQQDFLLSMPGTDDLNQ